MMEKKGWGAWSEERRLWTVFLGGCFLLGLLFIYRTFLGFNTADEMYFVGTTERLFQGDRLLIDEWHPSQQLSSFFIYPPLSYFKAAIGFHRRDCIMDSPVRPFASFICCNNRFWEIKAKRMECGYGCAAILYFCTLRIDSAFL